MISITNKQLAKLWTAWFLFTFGWGFWHGVNNLPMTGWAAWSIQVVSIWLTVWVVIRLWHTPNAD
jgi:hypothetical protein